MLHSLDANRQLSKLIMENTLIQLLQDSAQRLPHKRAIVQGDQIMSYQALWEKSCGLAHHLVNKGLEKGDRVALLVENSPDYVVAYYGVMMAGGVVTGLNTAAKSRDLNNWIQHSESRIVIANARHGELQVIQELNRGNEIDFIIIDDKDNIVSRIDEQGNFYILGEIIENSNP